jgi:antirestriction protein ArdC
MSELAIDLVLAVVFLGEERLSRDEIYRRALAIPASAEIMTQLDTLPEGEYSEDEVSEAVDLLKVQEEFEDDSGAVRAAGVSDAAGMSDLDEVGIPAEELSDEDLMRELAVLHRTREDALQHGSSQALSHHTDRSEELESEYVRRFPDRAVESQRTRAGARARAGGKDVTGAA